MGVCFFITGSKQYIVFLIQVMGLVIFYEVFCVFIKFRDFLGIDIYVVI